MDDKKEFDALETPENAADAVTPESAASSDTAPGKAPEDEKLSGELEKLKNMFRSELKKAREEVENESAQKESADILIQDVEPMENAPVPEEPAEEIPEDMLCECCGENMRDTSVSEDFQYCETCYATMKKYPYSWRYFLLAAAFIVCMVFSCWKFVIDADSYSYYKQGLAYEKERKITSAHEMYTKAMSAFDYDISRTQNIARHSAEIGFKWGSFSNASIIISSEFNASELKLPHNKKMAQLRQDAAIVTATQTAAYNLLSPYVNSKPEEIPYDDLIAQLDALVDKTTTIEGATDEVHDHEHDHEEGEEHEETTAAASGETTVNAEVEKITVEYNEVIIRFYQYNLAVMCGKDASVQLDFLEKARAADTEDHKYFSVYAYYLSVLYLEKRDAQALESVLELYSYNVEEKIPLNMRANLARLNKDYGSAISLCEQANKIFTDNHESYRQMAIAYLLQGNYAKAHAAAKTAYENGQSSGNLTFATCYTYIICAHANGTAADVTEGTELIEGAGYPLPEEVSGFINGTVTAAQIYLEGSGEIN